MYRPRRTTEFGDDVFEDNNVIRRQTRNAARSIAEPSSLPQGHVGSRFGGRSLFGGAERERSVATAQLPSSTSKLSAPSCSGTGGGNSFSATPMRQHLHMDKKWVQEQAQLLTEYFQEVLPLESMPGFSMEFFGRPNALRHLSIKQFVGICNFFFHSIWPSKVTVGVNHAEDIMNALQRLNYPHQLNKSWLMTPTAQHAFGHVVVMLDFLKDFGPPSSYCPDGEFQFMETNEQPSYVNNMADSLALSTTNATTANATTTNALQAPIQLDAELNAHIFAKAAESFRLWDKNLMDDCNRIKRTTANLLVEKRCGLPHLEALRADTARQEKVLADLQQQVAALPDQSGPVKRLQQLQQERQQLSQQQVKAKQSRVELEERLQDLLKSCQEIRADTETLRSQLARLRQQVAAQSCSQEEFVKLQFQLSDLQHQAELAESKEHDLAEREHKKLVQLSHAKKQMREMQEQFNKRLRHLVDVGLCDEGRVDELEVTLEPQLSVLESRLVPIGRLDEHLRQQIARQEGELMRLEAQSLKQDSLHSELELEMSKMLVECRVQDEHQAKLEAQWRQQKADLRQNLLRLKEEQYATQCKLAERREQYASLQQQLHKMKAENEELLRAAEEKQAEDIARGDALLEQQNVLLDEAEQGLGVLRATLAQNQLALDELGQQLDANQLPDLQQLHQRIDDQ